MITIRKALPEDRPALDALLRTSWLENWAPNLAPETVARFHATDPVGDYLNACLPAMDVAVIDGMVAGMCHSEGDMLHALHVGRDWQNRGVGSALLSDAQDKGAVRLEVRMFNERARRFYIRHGWRKTKRYAGDEMGEQVETAELSFPG